MLKSRFGNESTDVEYQGDGSKATFIIPQKVRVDFRQLIKEYLHLSKQKIDMEANRL